MVTKVLAPQEAPGQVEDEVMTEVEPPTLTDPPLPFAPIPEPCSFPAPWSCAPACSDALPSM
jgi:hypothetical protein